MEISTMKDMVKDRDEKIKSLEKIKEKQELQIEKYQAGTEQVQVVSDEHIRLHKSQVDEIKKGTQECVDKIEELTFELQGRNFGEYITAMKVNNSNPMYVLRAQAQLCMAMHNMGILENQLTMVKDGCQSFVRSIRKEINGQIDDKCKLEIELMSQLAILDGDSRKLEEKLKERLNNAEKEEKELKQEAVEKGYDENSPAENNADDDIEHQIRELEKQIETVTAEKRLMEEDLRAVVADRTATISELEKEASKQRDTIKEFELQIEDKRRILENRKLGSEHVKSNGHGPELVE